MTPRRGRAGAPDDGSAPVHAAASVSASAMVAAAMPTPFSYCSSASPAGGSAPASR